MAAAASRAPSLRPTTRSIERGAARALRASRTPVAHARGWRRGPSVRRGEVGASGDRVDGGYGGSRGGRSV